MIIYNTKEMATKYMLKDEVVIEIHSMMSPEEMLEFLRNGGEITEDIATITAFAINDGEIITQAQYAADVPPSNYGYENYLDSDHREALEERADARNKRQDLFKAFEAFQFNRSFRNFEFHQHEITKDQLITQLYAALEIMPTIKDIPDKSISELRRMSVDGDRLYWNFSDISYNNHLPSRADIEFYASLGDYEKRIINESGVHPAKLLDIAKGIKEGDAGRLLTIKEEEFAKGRSVETAVNISKTPGFNLKTILGNYSSKKDFDLALWMETELNDVRYEEKMGIFYTSLFAPSDTQYTSLSAIRMEYSKRLSSNNKTADKWKEDMEFDYFAKEMFANRVFPESILEEYKNSKNDRTFINSLKKEYERIYKEEFLPKYTITENGETVSFEADNITEFINSIYKKPMPEVIKKADTVFKELFHGHAPRVLIEYMYGQFYARNIDPKKATDAQIRDIAKAFDQKNVSKIAKYKNMTLFGIADKINFNEVKIEHMIAIASYVKPENLNILIKRGFIEWYKAHKDINLSDLVELLNYQTQIKAFDVNRDSKDLITDITQAYGKEQCRLMENVYHFDFKDNELSIKGRHIVAQEGKLKMYMLQKDDYRNFTVGYDTDCCQHYGGAGATCVYKLATDPFAGCVIIERDGNVLAQGFIWTDEAQDTLVFDNVEFADDRKIGQFNSIFAAWCQAMPYNNIHVGVGCNHGMHSWGKQVTYGAKLPTTLSDSRCYSDYRASDARSLKKDGQMQISCKTNVKITKAPDEKTKWDVLARPETSFLLNDCHSSIENRLEFARNFLNEQTPEIQMEAIRKNIQAIRYINNPTEEVQRYVVNKDPKLATLIQNPCRAVQTILIDLDPSYIRNIVNPQETMQKKAVQYNGLLLGDIENPSEEVQKMAVQQNGYAIRFIENPTEEMQLIAVKSSPKVVSLLENATERVQRTAVNEDPSVISLIERPSEALQMYAVEKNPYVINNIESPSYNAVKKAINLNGLLIRKFQYTYPHLRELALKKNGFAIQVLSNPTEEEYVLAVKQNRAVVNMIRNPQLQANVLAAVNGRHEEREEVEFD